jgi:hypothetical protein
MLMKNNERQGHRHLLISLFILAALLPTFCSDMVRDVETASLYRPRSLTYTDDGRYIDGDVPDDVLAAAAVRTGDVTGDRTRHHRRIVRHYRLLNRCSGRHVRVTTKRADAKAQFDDIYAELRVVSESFGSHVRIQSALSLDYLCFNRHGRLIVKHQTGRGSNCVFQELQTVDHFTEFRSTYNADWYIGFSRRGERLLGDSWKCVRTLQQQQQQQDYHASPCDQQQHEEQQQLFEETDSEVSRHRRRHNRLQRLLHCRQFVKTDMKLFDGYDVNRPSAAATAAFGSRLDFRRLYVRLKETTTGNGNGGKVGERKVEMAPSGGHT